MIPFQTFISVILCSCVLLGTSSQISYSYSVGTPITYSTGMTTTTRTVQTGSLFINHPIVPGKINHIIFGPALINQQGVPVPLVGFSYGYKVSGLPSWASYFPANNTIRMNPPLTFNANVSLIVSYSDFKNNEMKLTINLFPRKEQMGFNFMAADAEYRKADSVTIAFPTFANFNLDQQLSSQIFIIDSGVAPWTVSVKLVASTQYNQGQLVLTDQNGIVTISNSQSGDNSAKSNGATTTIGIVSSGAINTNNLVSQGSTANSATMAVSSPAVVTGGSGGQSQSNTGTGGYSQTSYSNKLQVSPMQVIHSPLTGTTPYFFNGVLITPNQKNVVNIQTSRTSSGSLIQGKSLASSHSGTASDYSGLSTSTLNSNSNTNTNSNSTVTENTHFVKAHPPLINGHGIVVVNEVSPIGQISRYQYSTTPTTIPPPINLPLSTPQPLTTNSTTTTTTSTTTQHSLTPPINTNTQHSSSNNNLVIQSTSYPTSQPINITRTQSTTTTSQFPIYQSSSQNTNTGAIGYQTSTSFSQNSEVLPTISINSINARPQGSLSVAPLPLIPMPTPPLNQFNQINTITTQTTISNNTQNSNHIINQGALIPSSQQMSSQKVDIAASLQPSQTQTITTTSPTINSHSTTTTSQTINQSLLPPSTLSISNPNLNLGLSGTPLPITSPQRIYSSQNATHYVQLIKVPIQGTKQSSMTINNISGTSVSSPPANLPNHVQQFKYEGNNPAQLASILASLNISIPQTLFDQSIYRVESPSPNQGTTSGSANTLSTLVSSTPNTPTITSFSTSSSADKTLGLNTGFIVPNDILSLTTSTIDNANKLSQNIVSPVPTVFNPPTIPLTSATLPPLPLNTQPTLIYPI